MLRSSDGDMVAVSRVYRHPLVSALTPLLCASLRGRSRRRGGWDDAELAFCALLMGWSESPTLRDRFSGALGLAGPASAHSYTGFSRALCRRGVPVVGRARACLAERLKTLAPGVWTVRGWCAFAADGSRFDVPRTADNESQLGVSGRGRGTPQMLSTVLVHLGSGVLWNWRIARGDGSERAGMRRMAGSTPKGSLLVMDAGFAGYECLREVIAGGRHVLLRLAGNVHLISGLHPDKDVKALRPTQRRRGDKPVWLRVIRLRKDGKEVVLGTSVLDPARLSDKDAAAIYSMRWGVEVTYRSLKQTMERRKMRSAAPARAWVELHWTMLSFMTLGVLTLSRMGRRRMRRRWSVAEAIRVVRHAAHSKSNAQARRHLLALGHAVTADSTRTSKGTWNWPDKKHPKAPGPPTIRQPTRGERTRFAATAP